MKKNSPIYIITPGDPAGIGGEVTLKALHKLRRLPKYKRLRFLIIGSSECFSDSKNKTNLKQFTPITSIGDIENSKLWRASKPLFLPAPEGHGGKQSGWSLETAAQMILEGQATALITGPIHKERLQAGGYAFSGHTDFLEHLCSLEISKNSAEPSVRSTLKTPVGLTPIPFTSVSPRTSDSHSKLTSMVTSKVTSKVTPKVTMMLYNSQLRVALATTHTSLASVSTKLTPQVLETTFQNTLGALLTWFKIKKPRIAVCALNPHAGEGGILGTEEQTILIPTLEKLRVQVGKKCEIFGPIPSDTLFANIAAQKIRCDAVIAMYHDQGLIPVKLLDFPNTINISLGLPFVRTSVDHGVAFDIAGKNMADPSSMIMAIKEAVRLSQAP